MGGLTGTGPSVRTGGARNAKGQRVRYMANLSGERCQQAVREHETMLGALGARDGARLGSILRDHLAHKLVMVLDALEAEVAAEVEAAYQFAEESDYPAQNVAFKDLYTEPFGVTQ